MVNPHPDSRWRKKQPMELQKLDKVHRVRQLNAVREREREREREIIYMYKGKTIQCRERELIINC